MSYPGGHAEVTVTRERAKRAKRMDYDPETGEILDRPPPPERSSIELVNARCKSVARSRTSIRRAIMASQADHMLTLTYRRNETNLENAWRDFMRFARLMRERLPSFSYVVVAEQQKRGAWHFHAAVVGRQNLTLIRECWALAGADGNINVRRWKGHVWRMGAYMSKYMLKSFDLNGDSARGERAHRYRRSQGHGPIEHVEIVSCDPREAREWVAKALASAGLIGFGQVEGGTPGEIDYYVWGCTWLDPP